MTKPMDDIGLLIGSLLRAQDSVRIALRELEEATFPHLEQFLAAMSSEATASYAGKFNSLLKEKKVGNLNREMRIPASEYALVGYDEEAHALEWSAGEADEFLIRLPIDYILSSDRWTSAFFAEMGQKSEPQSVGFGELLAALQNEQGTGK